jgi:hypothetical protein
MVDPASLPPFLKTEGGEWDFSLPSEIFNFTFQITGEELQLQHLFLLMMSDRPEWRRGVGRGIFLHWGGPRRVSFRRLN